MSSNTPLIAHVVHRLDYGGLENGVVNLINRLPRERYRHAVICLTDYTEFARRIERTDVQLLALHKKSGKDLPLYGRFVSALRRLQPAIVHTRNFATIDMQPFAAAYGIAGRVHSEHGFDVYDLLGTNRSNLRIRRLIRPFVKRYIALSKDIERWLLTCVKVRADRIDQIYNGVDMQRFSAAKPVASPWPSDFANENNVVIGSVGRLAAVKAPMELLLAFCELIRARPEARSRLRLAIVGDGPLRQELLSTARARNIADLLWMPGARDDIPAILAALDVFVLPSLNEGVSNTILEAMACGTPVVARRVGGNPELVEDEVTGSLFHCASPNDGPTQLAKAIEPYVFNAEMRHRRGAAARRCVEQRFSMQAMLDAYANVYDELLVRSR
jgi:sugar transferase (PEP-CTERM/EpsH1 system associated)